MFHSVLYIQSIKTLHHVRASVAISGTGVFLQIVFGNVFLKYSVKI